MNLHEYQGKSILREYNVSVPESLIANTKEEAIESAKKIQEATGVESWAVKAQIHAGGRGKGGGVKIAKSLEEVGEFANDILGMMLITPQTSAEGKKVNRVLIEQSIYYEGPSSIEEYYMSVLLNRDTGRNIIMYSPEGGMSIEEVAEASPEKIFKEEIDPGVGLQGFQCRKIAFNLGLSGKAFKEMCKFVAQLYQAYEGSDAAMFEINPVFKTSDDRVFAADSKVTLDDNALFRHKDYIEMRDESEEDPIEVEADKYDLNFSNILISCNNTLSYFITAYNTPKYIY